MDKHNNGNYYVYLRMLVYDNSKRASSSKLIEEIELNSTQIETPNLIVNDLASNQKTKNANKANENSKL